MNKFKIISISSLDMGRLFVYRELLPEFPVILEQVPSYLAILSPVMEGGLVTRREDPIGRQSKLQFIIAALSIYRLIELFGETIKDIPVIGDKTSDWIDFCIFSKSKFDSIENLHRKREFYLDLFNDDLDPVKKMIIHYPSKIEVGEELKKLSGARSSSNGDSPSSSGREDYISITNATLRRLLKNYWDASLSSVGIDDELLRQFWDMSILGTSYPIARVQNAICFFPVELSFLFDRDTNCVTDFAIGISNETARKQAKEVRAITVNKVYIAKIIQLNPSFEDHKDLINKTYLSVVNDGEFDDYVKFDLSLNSLERNEFLFKYLDYKGVIEFSGSDIDFDPNTLPESFR